MTGLGWITRIATDNTLSGSDAVDISQALRARATQLWKTSKMFPEYEDQAVAVNKAVDNLEDSVAPNLKDPEQWALDRAKNAQSYNVQSSLGRWSCGCARFSSDEVRQGSDKAMDW